MFITRPTKILVLVISLTLTINSYAQKMTAEEVIEKHLNSIAPKEKRETIKNQLIVSDIEAKVSGRAGVFGGKAIIFSASGKNVWGININADNATPDRFGYNGKQTRVAFIQADRRSLLGGFVNKYNKLVEESLLGGALSNSWALLNIANKKPKLSYEGTKKIDDMETVVLSYSPKGGSSMTIKMFFDTQNFHHVRTEYTIVQAAMLGSIDSSAGRDSSRERLVETFSDFRNMGDLTLPGLYKINYSATGGRSVQVGIGSDRLSDVDWTFKVTNYSFNQEADEKAFDIDVKK